MIWINGAGEIHLMTGDTFGLGIRKITSGMATFAVGEIMSEHKREKIMVDIFRAPIPGQWVMTFNALGRITAGHMIGTGSTLIVCKVTTDAIIADPVKSQMGLGLMAIYTRNALMGAHERKPVVFMDLRNVVN
jgi:hypothetical protein